MSVPMTATKDMKYRTRRLKPGDKFRVKSEQEARILAHLKKAETDRNPHPGIALDDARGNVGLKPLAPASEGIAALRQAYTRKTGKRFFPGWSAEQLREKIAAA